MDSEDISSEDGSSTGSATSITCRTGARAKLPAKKREASAKCWCFTINNPVDGEILPPNNMVTYMIYGRETGANGTKHFQGYVQFKNRHRFEALKKLVPKAHWEKAKGSPLQNFKYCSKDGDFIEVGDRPKGPKEKDTTFSEALAATSVREGLAIIKNKRPREYLIHGEAIERNLRRHRTPKFSHVYTTFNRQVFSTHKPLLFWGPAGTGKTHFALFHFKNPLIVSHLDILKQLSPDHDGIVFDDLSFKHFPPESVIHLLDSDIDRDLHVRYTTANVPKNTPKIFTHNTSNPFYNDSIDEEQKKAIERRFQRVHIPYAIFTVGVIAPPSPIAPMPPVIFISDDEDSFPPTQPYKEESSDDTPTAYQPGWFIPETPPPDEETISEEL